ncbi:MAG: hypothetical protein WAT46_14815 [Saprospiraceae bacterium]
MLIKEPNKIETNNASLSDLPLPSFSTNLRSFGDIIYAFQACPTYPMNPQFCPNRSPVLLRRLSGRMDSESLTSPTTSAQWSNGFF